MTAAAGSSSADSIVVRGGRMLLRRLDDGARVLGALGRMLGRGPNSAQRAAVIALSGLMGMSEVNKILESVRLTANSATTGDVYGVTPWKVGEPFAAWATVSATVPIGAWLLWHIAFDVLFIAGYAVLLERLYPPAHAKRVRFRRWLVALVILDLCEDALAAATAARLPVDVTPAGYVFSGGPWLIALGLSTALKWILAAVVVSGFGYAWWQETLRFSRSAAPGAVNGRWARWWIAVKMQRFSVLLVAVLAVFLLAPGSDLLDQIPDIVRTWVLSGWDRHAIGHGLLAAASAALLWLALWCLGRTRTLRAYVAYELGGAQPRANRPLAVLLAIAGYLLLAVLLDATGWAQVDWTVVWITAGVLFAIPLGSVLTRGIRIPAGYPDWPTAPGAWVLVLRLGDGLAVWSFAMFWLCLFRSSIGPLMLETAETILPLAFVVLAGLGIACWIVGIVGRQRDGVTRRASRSSDGEIHSVLKVVRDAVGAAVKSVEALGSWIRRTLKSRPTAVTLGGWVVARTAPLRRWIAAANEWLDGPHTGPPPVEPRPAAAAPAAAENPEQAAGEEPAPAAQEEPVPVDVVPTSVPVSPRLRPGSPLHPQTQQYLKAAGVILAVLAAVVLGWFVVHPLGASADIGALAVLICGFLILTSLFTAATLLAQVYRPARVFRIVGIRATPAMTVLLILGLLVPQFQASDALHAARSGTAAGAAAVQWAAGDLATDLTAWMDGTGPGSTADCAMPVAVGGRQVRVMPLAIVGAAGGGARAAWWTVAAMTQVKNSPCVAHSVFLASGASGGSMGLATMLAAADPVSAARQLVAPPALSAAVDGLVIRDAIAGFSGFTLGAVRAPTDARYPDRSVLMETVWQRAIAGFAQPFPLLPYDSPAGGDRLPAQVPWHTVFNTTSAISGCRVVISDVDLRPMADRTPPSGGEANVGTGSPSSASPGGAQATSCGTDDDPVPATSNLYLSNTCQRGMPLVTAALMSSRFPFVTPSGVVGGTDDCGSRDQLIDGGYSENSGIGTAADVLDLLMPTVRAHNARQLVDHQFQPTLVVPVVISVENKPRPVVGGSADQPRISETFVPLLAGLRRSDRLYDTVGQLERALAMTDDWCVADGCDQLKAAAEDVLDGRAVVVAPYRAPQVTAPLGWVLSPASRDSLDYSMRANLECNGGIATPAGTPDLHPDDCPPTVSGAFGRYIARLRAQDPPR